MAFGDNNSTPMGWPGAPYLQSTMGMAMAGPSPASSLAPRREGMSMPSDMDFNDIMAPYRASAEQFTSPYALFGRNSWIAQNHPGAARILDSIGLAGAMTPGPQGPEGVGGGISRAFQGLVGAQGYRRQMMLQNAMLPYQMAMPRLQAEKEIAETQMWRQHAGYFNRMVDVNQEKADIAKQRADIQQEAEDRKKFGPFASDPSARIAFLIHPPKDPMNPTPEEAKAIQSEYEQIKETARREPSSQFERIEAMRRSPDAAIKAEGERQWQDMVTLSGAKTGAESGAKEPFVEDRDFMNKEYANAQKQIEKPVEMFKFFEQYAKDLKWSEKIKGDSLGAYNEYLQQKQVEKQQFERNWSTYYSSGVWKGKGKVGFDTYVKNPNKYDPAAPQYAPNPATSSGSQWQPK